MLLPNFVVLLVVSLIFPAVVYGQVYPSKTIRIVTGPVGGSADFTARQIAQGISGPLGQSAVVDNRASLAIAAEVVAKSPPDGYTLLVSDSSLWHRPLLATMPYDAIRDLSPISLTDRNLFIIAVHPSVAANTVKELIALARARPGQLNYGSGPAGSTSHLAVELFKAMAGINIVWVPYKGSSQALIDLLGGQLQLTIMDTVLLAPHIKSGKLRALAVTSAQPSALAPGLPTVAASGLPGYESAGVRGMLAPARTPEAIVRRLNQEVVQTLRRQDVRERFLNAGLEVVGSSPEEFAAFIRADIARMAKVIKDAGIQPN